VRRDVPGEALDLDLARDQVEDAAVVLDAGGDADDLDGDADRDLHVHQDAHEVDVDGLARDGSRWSSGSWRGGSGPSRPASEENRVLAAPARNASAEALRSTEIGTFGFPAPYTTPGIRPSARTRRASPFPASSASRR
jgi:hypothetical protein